MVQELRPSTLITHRFDITQAQRAFDLLAVGAPDVLQFILVYPSS
jgi:threonine dehydrogenase-like Zn-dependent dehydrogenase